MYLEHMAQSVPPPHSFAASVITSKIIRRMISLGYSIKYKTGVSLGAQSNFKRAPSCSFRVFMAVCVFFINYTLFPVAVLPFPSLSSVGRSSNEQYVCIACYQEARFSEAFLLPSCINHTQIM